MPKDYINVNKINLKNYLTFVNIDSFLIFVLSIII